MNLSVIGLGKLGLCSAACFAARGHTVIGVDSNADLLADLRQGRCPIRETGLADLLRTAGTALHYTDDSAEAVAGSDITLIIVPTPSRDDGAFSNEYVLRALEQLAPALAAKESFHVVDIVSTVMPGSCEREFLPLLEGLSGKVCGRDFGLVYNPEFIALGSVIRDFLHPDLVLIGASDERSANAVRGTYASMVESEPRYGIMSLLNAEIAKLGLNCFVTMKISFANELAALCERIPGADVDAVSEAVGADSRVGRKYLTGGLGFGGTCFPRDNRAFQAVGRAFGYEPLLSPRVIAVNDAVPDRIFALIRERTPPSGPVALFGLSYKQDTHIVEESQAVLLARRLLAAEYALRLHDPLALDEARAALGAEAAGRVVCCPSPYEAAQDATAVILLTDWPQFKRYDWERLEQAAAPGALLLDAWRILRGREFGNFAYRPLGLGRPRDDRV
jgi:UDPglucose 6-dehydrogenase